MTVAVAATGLLLAGQLEAASATAAPTVLRLSAAFTRPLVHVSTQFTLTGTVAPKRKGVVVQRQSLVAGRWQDVPGGKAVTNSKGQWRMRLTAPAEPTTLRYRLYTPKVKRSQPLWKSIRVLEPPRITLSASKFDHPAGMDTTMYGRFDNVGANVQVTLQQQVAGVWTELPNLVTYGEFAWSARFKVPDVPGSYLYRVMATGSLGTATSRSANINVVAPSVRPMDRLGPGSPAGIWGMDVSRWNHMAGDTNKDGKVDINDDGKPIDFTKSYQAGARFVYIKGTDGSASGVGQMWADKFAASDRKAAQAAGLYTGYYHFIGMVETNNRALLVADARDEAIMAAARVAADGGYNSMDLPYALDVEHDDFAGSGVADVTTDENIYLWIRTWLLEMEARTGRIPIIYSGPSAMESEFVKSDFWSRYQIWVAHPTCRFFAGGPGELCTEDMINRGAQPGFKASGIGYFNTPWTVNALLNWTFWQYRASVMYSKDFGMLNGSALDMNVYRGTDEDWAALTSTIWVPTEGDYQATNSEVAITGSYEAAGPGEPLRIAVRVNRASNGAPAVSGSLQLSQNLAPVSGASVEVTGIGTWLITLPATEIGFVWQDLQLDYTDGFKFYLPARKVFSVAADGSAGQLA